jgi:tetratricopeptide (TPR) repeat protein
VRGELDWIVMKALEKDRARRYATAEGFAEDVRRYLDGEAVVAAPPSAAYRLRKFLRRNRAVAGASAAVAVSLLAGVFAFAWQARIARRERDRAVAAEAEIAKRADELAQVSDFQAKMLEKIDPTQAGIELVRNLRAKHAKALEESGVPEADRPARMQAFEEELARVNATDTALATIDGTILAPAVGAIDMQFKDQPLVEARLRHTLANLYVKLGRYEVALPLQENALETRRRILGEKDPDTILSVNDMGNLLEMKATTRAPSPSSARPWRSGAPARRGARRDDRLDDESGRQSSVPGPVRRRRADAPEGARDVEARDRRRCEGHADVPERARVPLRRRGQARRSGAALARHLREGAAGSRSRRSRSPRVGEQSRRLLGSMGKLAEAETFYREAYEATRRVRGEEHPGTLTCASNLASNLTRQGRYAEAEPLERKTLETRRRVLGASHPDTIASLEAVGNLLKNQGSSPRRSRCSAKRSRPIGAHSGTSIRRPSPACRSWRACSPARASWKRRRRSTARRCARRNPSGATITPIASS